MTYPPLILGYTAHQRRPVVLDADASFPHRVLVGGTGKGKTSFLMGLVYQQLRRGGGCIFVDGKAKPQNLLTIAHLAHQTGRWSLLRAIAPGLPWSHLYNPLHAEREISEAVNFLLNLLPPVSVQSEAQHYRDQVRSFLLTTLEVLRATGKTATIRDLLAIMTAPAHVIEEKLRADLKDSRHEERFGDLHYITRGMLKDKRETLSGMVAQLQSITATDLGNFLSTVFSDLDLTTAVDVGMPVWMALPTSSDQARANALGRAFLADILAVMADLTGDRRPTPIPPFLIVLDEFGSYALAEFAEMLRKAREANIQVVVSLTTIADLQDPTRGLTTSFPDQLLGNAEAIYMGSWAPGTLRYAAEYYGEEKQLIASRRESLAQNVSGRLASAEDRYWNPQLGTARTVFDQLTEKREPRLRKELLNELRQHEAIVFFQGHPTLVHLVYYFAPVTERNKDPATVVPTWLRAPLQPAGLSEYVLAHHVQIVKTAAANGTSPESATPPAKATPARTATPARKRTRPKPDAPPA